MSGRLLASLAALLVVAGAAAAVAWMWTARGPTPRPPDLAHLGPLAPDIRDIVQQALAAVSEKPRDGRRWGEFGMVCEANGLMGAARDAYATASALQPAEPKWRYHLASVEARLGQADQAVRDMRRVTELKPDYAPAFWHLGLWLLDDNQTQAAEAAFTRATEIDPADRAGSLGLARVYLQRGETRRAADVLERLVASDGGDRYALQLLGTAYRRLGRADEAQSALIVGATGVPQWIDPWADEMLAFRRGFAARLKDATAYIAAGQLQPALRILEPLHLERPDDVVLTAHLGGVYVAAGRDVDAIPLLEQAIAREPDRFEPYVDLATAYMHRNALAPARTAADHAVALNPSYSPAHETLGLVLWRAGDQERAVKSLETAARLDPRNTRALVWLGMLQTNRGRMSDARVAFEGATEADPTSVDAWIGLANAEMNRHQLEAAAAALNRAQQLQPDRAAVKETAERLRSLRTESDRHPARPQ